MKSRFPFGVGGQRPKPAPPPPPTPQKKNKITKKKKEERDFSSFLSPFHDNEEKQIKRRLPDMCAVGGGGGGGWWGGGGRGGRPAGRCSSRASLAVQKETKQLPHVTDGSFDFGLSCYRVFLAFHRQS